jgi:hypothetical protein
MPQLLYPQYPQNRKMGGPQKESRCGGKEKKSPYILANIIYMYFKTTEIVVCFKLPRYCDFLHLKDQICGRVNKATYLKLEK